MNQPTNQQLAQQPIATHQTLSPIAPIDPQAIIEHGNSPTAIILAIAILIFIVFGSVTGLVRVIVVALVRQGQTTATK